MMMRRKQSNLDRIKYAHLMPNYPGVKALTEAKHK